MWRTQFQSLTGRLKTAFGWGVGACVSVFQSLTGRLKTYGVPGALLALTAFQSLTGRLKTELQRAGKLARYLVSIPHR